MGRRKLRGATLLARHAGRKPGRRAAFLLNAENAARDHFRRRLKTCAALSVLAEGSGASRRFEGRARLSPFPRSLLMASKKSGIFPSSPIPVYYRRSRKICQEKAPSAIQFPGGRSVYPSRGKAMRDWITCLGCADPFGLLHKRQLFSPCLGQKTMKSATLFLPLSSLPGKKLDSIPQSPH